MDLNFEQLVQKYQARQKEQEEMAFKAKYVEHSGSTLFGEVKNMSKKSDKSLKLAVHKSPEIVTLRYCL